MVVKPGDEGGGQWRGDAVFLFVAVSDAGHQGQTVCHTQYRGFPFGSCPGRSSSPSASGTTLLTRSSRVGQCSGMTSELAHRGPEDGALPFQLRDECSRSI